MPQLLDLLERITQLLQQLERLVAVPGGTSGASVATDRRCCSSG
jgi:hypothetical protein